MEKNGKVVYKQKVIPNSNIITLITHAIQNNKSKPVGMKSFNKILAKANIPSKLISKRRLTYYEKNIKEVIYGDLQVD